MKEIKDFTSEQTEKFTWMLTNKKLSGKRLRDNIAIVIKAIEVILWNKDWEI